MPRRPGYGVTARGDGYEVRRRKFLAYYQRLALAKGGVLLSPAYAGSQTRLQWRCAAGHEWSAVPNTIRIGGWCPTCSGRTPYSIEELRAIAVERGGECLSPQRVRRRRLRWRCAEGHEWSSHVSNILAGHWCPVCGDTVPLTLDDMHEAAAEWGGECLSKRYVDGKSKLVWRCRFGHVFRVRATFVRDGGWCPTCRGTREVGSIARMRAIARRRGGECLSGRYVDARTPLRWRCREGHEWEAVPGNIAQGKWCRRCANASLPGRVPPPTIEDMRALARSRGGLCLSSAYGGHRHKLRWRCRCGHEWMAAPSQVKHSSWCPMCAKRYPGSIDGMRALAHERGGRCLSHFYDGHTTVLRFECRERHRFALTGREVKTGLWCPTCARASATRRTGPGRAR